MIAAHRRRLRAAPLAVAALLLTACSAQRLPPIRTVAHVDLGRFMGDWYVIAAIPTFIDKNAYGAVESYALRADGTIDVRYRFHAGGFDGPLKVWRPRARVLDKVSNARWGMQFVWPIKAQYLIAYVSVDYGEAIIARDARDFVWILARKPSIAVGEYLRLRGIVASLDYDTSKLRLYPQRPRPAR
ncbi:MAG TPA: lipocalin family protein [Steroidobacteraceae bacterium]|nr:lipocalin family protein [Steroidobacteraceae bacterium]